MLQTQEFLMYRGLLQESIIVKSFGKPYSFVRQKTITMEFLKEFQSASLKFSQLSHSGQE